VVLGILPGVQVIEIPDTAPTGQQVASRVSLSDPVAVEYAEHAQAVGDAQVLAVSSPLDTGSGAGVGALPFSTRTVTADTTARPGELLEVDATAGEVVVTPPPSPAPGTYLTVLKVDNTANRVLWSGTVNEDPDGAEIVSTQAAATFVFDGVGWVVESVNTSYNVSSAGDYATQAAVDAVRALIIGGTPSSAPVVREVVHGSNPDTATGPLSITTSSGVQAGDTVLVIHGNDWNVADVNASRPASVGMQPPGGNSLTWTLATGVVDGLDVPHIKVWQARAVSPGSLTVTLNQASAGSDSYFGAVYVLVGDIAVEASRGVRGVGPSQSAPTLTAPGGNRLLLSVWQTPWVSGSGITTWSATPAGMTQRTLDAEGAHDAGTGAMLTATGVIGTSGPTPIETAVYQDARAFAALSMLLVDPSALGLAQQVPTLEEIEGQVFLGPISATRWPPLTAANVDQRVAALSLTCAGDIGASDTNYWTVEVVRWRAGTASTIATRTTQTNAPNGGVAAYVAWTLDLIAFGAAQYLQKGDVLGLRMTPTGSPSLWPDLTVSWRTEPGVTA
jgi:hypothetical protein